MSWIGVMTCRLIGCVDRWVIKCIGGCIFAWVGV